MALRTSKPREVAKHMLIGGVLLMAFFPLYLMIVISFKSNDQFSMNPFLSDAPSAWNLGNWEKGWGTVKVYIANSVVTSAAAVLLCLVMAVLTSDVLARHRFPGRSVIYYGLIATMFMPGTAATLVTLFTLIKDLHMLNSLVTLIIVGAIGGQVVCIFILRQFIEEIPRELFEAADIDGAGPLQQIVNLVIPMSAPIIGTLAIMQFIANWNSLMLPLVILRDEQLLTIPVGLMRLDGEYVKQWGELMAAYTIASIPLVLLFVFTMRLFVKGLAAGAVKG